MESGFIEELGTPVQPKTQQKQQQPNKTNKTGARVAKTIAVLALATAVGLGVYYGNQAVKDYQETDRAESLVASYMDEDRLVNLPEGVMINRAYDAKYCTGEKLVNELTAAEAAYCYINGEYYTEKGDTIAILTLEVTRTETREPIKVDVGGNVVYMAPEGYILQGNKCTKETITIETKVVPKNANNDYSNVFIDGASKAEIISIDEVDSKKYSAMNGCDLIVDVADGAQLENNQTEAVLRLIPRNK